MKPAVLLVDDSLTIRMDLKATFEAAGFVATTCGTAGAARQALSARAFALVVLDIRLPDTDGLNFLTELKASDAHGGTPVIMLSTDAQIEDRLRGLSLGAAEFIGKPYDRAALIQRARALLQADARDASPRTKPLVLLIDDSATFRQAMSRLLDSAGYDVVLASSGEEGLQLAAISRPDALITDGEMPGLDGEAVLQRLRQDPSLRHLPCLLLTASEQAFDEWRALEAGADAYLRKDAAPTLITARLATLLRSAEETLPEPADAHRVLTVGGASEDHIQLAAWCREEGYDHVHAGSLNEASAFLEQQSAACVLVAFGASSGEGLALCQRLREIGHWRDRSLVALLRDPDPGALLAAIDAGAEDVILQGQAPEVSRQRLRAVLRRTRLASERRYQREQQLLNELSATQARAALELAETRAHHIAELERGHRALEDARRKAEQATRAKSDFLANMSHEIRTPLTAITSVADLLAETPLSPVQARYVGMFTRASATLLALVNDLLDLSKIEAGHLALDASAFEVREFLTGVVGVAEVAAAAKGVAMDCRVAPNVPETVVGDANRLGQVLGNLLGNAVKFTERGEITILVACALEDEPGLVRFSVADTGVGIPPERWEAVFDEFIQADASTFRAFGGTGLGLSIARRLVEGMGGRLWLDSEVGRGSTFHFTAALLPMEEPVCAAPNATLRVLLAEDSEDNRIVFEAFFEGLDYDVVLVEDGTEAVRQFTLAPFDLVLMDLRMPSMDGFSATRAIRTWEQENGLTPTPIVALTAFATRTELAEARAAGCNAHLTKPIRREALLRAIAAHHRPRERSAT